MLKAHNPGRVPPPHQQRHPSCSKSDGVFTNFGMWHGGGRRGNCEQFGRRMNDLLQPRPRPLKPDLRTCDQKYCGERHLNIINNDKRRKREFRAALLLANCNTPSTLRRYDGGRPAPNGLCALFRGADAPAELRESPGGQSVFSFDEQATTVARGGRRSGHYGLRNPLALEFRSARQNDPVHSATSDRIELEEGGPSCFRLAVLLARTFGWNICEGTLRSRLLLHGRVHNRRPGTYPPHPPDHDLE
jgi:hypothetical protein